MWLSVIFVPVITSATFVGRVSWTSGYFVGEVLQNPEVSEKGHPQDGNTTGVEPSLRGVTTYGNTIEENSNWFLIINDLNSGSMLVKELSFGHVP